MKNKNIFLIRFRFFAVLSLILSLPVFIDGKFDSSMFKAALSGLDIPIQDASDADHPDIPIMYLRSDANYGDYYIAGDCGFHVEPEPISGFYDNSIAHCPDGALIKSHATRHVTHNLRLASMCQRGFFDGTSHYWCEKDGVAVSPILGPDSRGMPPDRSNNNAYLIKDGNSYAVSYFGRATIPLSGWATCEYGVAGPYENGTDPTHYFCLSSDGSRFIDPIPGPAPTTSIVPQDAVEEVTVEESVADEVIIYETVVEEATVDEEIVEEDIGDKVTVEKPAVDAEPVAKDFLEDGAICSQDLQCESGFCDADGLCAASKEQFFSEVEGLLDAHKDELAFTNPESDFHQKLKVKILMLEKFYETRKNRNLVEGATVDSSVIRDAMDDVDTFVTDYNQLKKDNFLDTYINQNLQRIEDLEKFVEKEGITDKKIPLGLSNLQASINDLKMAKDIGDKNGDLDGLIKHIQEVSNKTEKWAESYGYNKERDLAYAEILDDVDTAIAEKVERIFKDPKIFLDKDFKNLAFKSVKFSEKFSGDFEDKLTASLNQLNSVTDIKIRNELVSKRVAFIDELEKLDETISTSDVSDDLAVRIKTLMEKVVTVNWCGDFQEQVRNYFTSLDVYALNYDEIISLEDKLPSLDENHMECFFSGVAHFKDAQIHEWYFPAAEYVYDKGFVTGYSDALGNRTGDLGVGQPTLRIEALTMGMRLFDIPTVGKSDIWYEPYIDGAADKGVNRDWDWAMPINRLETADLFLDLMLLTNEEYITLPTAELTAIKKYPDYQIFKSDIESARAVEVFTDFGVFQGSGSTGNFDPYSNLLRSEYVTLIKRIHEVLSILSPTFTEIG